MVSGIKASINYLIVQCKLLGLTEATRHLEKANEALEDKPSGRFGLVAECDKEYRE